MTETQAQTAAPLWVRKALDIWHRTEVTIAVIAFLLVYDAVSCEILKPLIGVLGFENPHLSIPHSSRIAVYLLIVGAFSDIGIATWTGVQLVPKVGFGAGVSWTGSSIGDLFLAGVGPGLLLVMLFSIYSVVKNRGMQTIPFSFPQLGIALRNGIWSLLMPVILLGGFTPVTSPPLKPRLSPCSMQSSSKCSSPKSWACPICAVSCLRQPNWVGRSFR